jgi:protein arginine N-methyltransferase 1
MRIEYHRTLIADRVRIEAFHRALAQVIRRGETVVADIGTGTGILAFLAARLGARKVYAYETAEIGAVAQKLKALNKLKAVELMPMRSTEIIDPPRADVVVTETLGNYALEEFLVETMNDARARHLKPGGILIPNRVEQHVCPVVAPRLYDELCVWDQIGHGLDFGPARIMSLNNVYVRTFPSSELLDGGAAAQVWDRLDFSQSNRMTRKGSVRWPLSRHTTVYGLALWWTAELAADVALSTGPLEPPTHWEQLYFPALEPIVVEAGQSFGAELRSKSSEDGGTDLAWTLMTLDKAGRQCLKQTLALDKGFLP